MSNPSHIIFMSGDLLISHRFPKFVIQLQSIMAKSDSVYINPLTDFGFKFLFGQEENKEFLLSFLNAVFQGQREIVAVKFVDKERIGEYEDERALIYDVHCQTADGDRLIIEMQNRYQAMFRDRALYYLSADLYHQGRKGKDWDHSLIPVYGVFLMNFDWREGNDEPLREDVCLMNTRTHEVFSDRLGMTFLKIPMMVKDEEDCRDMFDKWLYLLKNMDKMEAMPKVFLNDPVFKRLGKVAQVAALKDDQRTAYDASLKAYRDAYAIARTERSEGFAESIDKGVRKVALNMIKLGLSDELIQKSTNLSTAQISELRNL